MTQKWILGRVLDASFFEGGFGEGFGVLLKGFGWILEGILDLRTEKLTLIFLCGISSD